MPFDLSFLSWVVSRRVPVFALVVAFILFCGNVAITNKEDVFFATAELSKTDNLLQGLDEAPDGETQVDFLSYRVTAAIQNDPTLASSGLSADHFEFSFDASGNRIRLGVYGPTQEDTLKTMNGLISLFVATADAMWRENMEQKVELHRSETEALRASIYGQPNFLDVVQTGFGSAMPDELEQTSMLLTASLERLAHSQAKLASRTDPVLQVINKPIGSPLPVGPSKRSMHAALASFAILCGLIFVLVLEWVDTVIRRPKDVERSLGLPVFAVVPDLHVQSSNQR